jgi:hypothetical protein
MTALKDNQRGFIITFTDGVKSGVQGPDITPDNIHKHTGSAGRHRTIAKVEEYFYEDTIKWQIDAEQKQIEICLKQIKDLTTELETL